MTTILDLPEPLRSQSLAKLGMTEQQFRDNMAAVEAWSAEKEEAIAAGLAEAGDLHYGDDLPGVDLVD